MEAETTRRGRHGHACSRAGVHGRPRQITSRIGPRAGACSHSTKCASNEALPGLRLALVQGTKQGFCAAGIPPCWFRCQQSPAWRVGKLRQPGSPGHGSFITLQHRLCAITFWHPPRKNESLDHCLLRRPRTTDDAHFTHGSVQEQLDCHAASFELPSLHRTTM
jgi:hypothetical protein